MTAGAVRTRKVEYNNNFFQVVRIDLIPLVFQTTNDKTQIWLQVQHTSVSFDVRRVCKSPNSNKWDCELAEIQHLPLTSELDAPKMTHTSADELNTLNVPMWDEVRWDQTLVQTLETHQRWCWTGSIQWVQQNCVNCWMPAEHLNIYMSIIRSKLQNIKVKT